MKKLLLPVFLLLLTYNAADAQTKVGTIDIDFIISKMPEIKGVQERLKDYGTTLDQQLEEKMKEYQAKLDDYNANIDSFTEQQISDKQSEIFTIEDDITKFRQNGMQLIRIREDELKRPLYTKLAGALEKVAQAEGYNQILSTSDGSSVIYMDPEYDITIAVMKALNIEINED